MTEGSSTPLPPPATPLAPWRGLRRVLAVRLDQLGDVLMTTPALAALHEGLPGVSLTLLTSPGAAAAAAHLPMVDAVWSARVPWMPATDCVTADALALQERIAAAGFDAAVIFNVCTQSALPAALLCQMAGVPHRLAYSRENPYGLLTHWLRDPDVVQRGAPAELQHEQARHEVRRQLDLVGAVGLHTADTRLRFEVFAHDRVAVAARLRVAGVPAGAPYAVLHPGASAASRRWPAARFGVVARALRAEGLVPVFTGGEGEHGLVAQALAAVPAGTAIDLAGRLPLGELGALIEGACVLVANNSAPAHLAAAVGTPVACLYALTNPQHTPWQVPSQVLHHDVSCRGCLRSICPERHHACLEGVTPERVAAAALALSARRLPVIPEIHP